MLVYEIVMKNQITEDIYSKVSIIYWSQQYKGQMLSTEDSKNQITKRKGPMLSTGDSI